MVINLQRPIYDSLFLSRCDSHLGLTVCRREEICLPNSRMLCHANVSNSGRTGRGEGREGGEEGKKCLARSKVQRSGNYIIPFCYDYIVMVDAHLILRTVLCVPSYWRETLLNV